MSVIQTVLDRGHAEQDETEELEKGIGLSRFWTEDREERFWGIRLTEDRFILCNHPIEFMGCPPVIGLVGIHKDHVMLTQPTLELFRATNRVLPKQEAQ